MKVAVVIPLYNHERFIGEALESVRQQSRPADRIIIIDDGSTDGSLNAVMAFSRSVAGQPPVAAPAAGAAPIETRTDLHVQPNAGAHAAINRAVELAAEDCDYVAILNSDDRFHPRRLERCLQYLEAHPELDLVCTRLRLIDEDGKTLAVDAPRARWFAAAWSFQPARDDTSKPDLAEWLGLANFAGTTSNFFARTHYLRNHPLPAYRFAHDYHAVVLAALENRLGVLETELLDYRIHARNTISTTPERLIREMLQVNVDLARQLAPRLSHEPELRLAFGRYQRAAWSNVSAFRADLFNLVLTGALAMLPSKSADALLAQFDLERFPEIAQFPNRAIVSNHNPSASALGPTGGLADKFYTLKAQLSALRASVRPWAEYRQLQASLLRSRWFALGRLLGFTAAIDRAGGKTGEEKLSILRQRVAQSPWLRLGARVGASSAGRLIAQAQTGAGEN